MFLINRIIVCDNPKCYQGDWGPAKEALECKSFEELGEYVLKIGWSAKHTEDGTLYYCTMCTYHMSATKKETAR